jgi:hypothetical protein
MYRILKLKPNKINASTKKAPVQPIKLPKGPNLLKEFKFG